MEKSLGHFLADVFVAVAKGVYAEMQATDSLMKEIDAFHFENAVDKALADRDEQMFMELMKQKESLVVGATNDSVEM